MNRKAPRLSDGVALLRRAGGFGQGASAGRICSTDGMTAYSGTRGYVVTSSSKRHEMSTRSTVTATSTRRWDGCFMHTATDNGDKANGKQHTFMSYD